MPPIPPPPEPLKKRQDQDKEFDSWVQDTRMQNRTEEVAVMPTKQEVIKWTKQSLELLKNTLVPTDVTDTEFALFVEVCKRRNLDPFARQIFAVKRSGKLVIQTSIDGYRLIAERSGKYLGQSPPEWCGTDGKWVDVWTDKGNPFACRIGVFKAGMAVPTIAVGYWNTYVAPGPFWTKSGPSQLAKCTEALALRKAFPEDLSGIYTSEEMQQAGEPLEATIVPGLNVPLVADESQPVMVFPKEIVATNAAGALIKDSNGLEWVFPTSFGTEISNAVEQSSFLLVNYVVDTGRRIVTGLGSV